MLREHEAGAKTEETCRPTLDFDEAPTPGASLLALASWPMLHAPLRDSGSPNGAKMPSGASRAMVSPAVLGGAVTRGLGRGGVCELDSVSR